MIKPLFIDTYINIFLEFLSFDDLLTLRLTCNEIKNRLYEKAEFKLKDSIEIQYPKQGLNLMKLFEEVKYHFEFRFMDNLTDQDIFHLVNLTDIDLHNNSKITDWGVANLTQVAYLTLGSLSRLTDQGLTNLINVQYVNLESNTMITDYGLASLPKLTQIDLENEVSITDEGISRLVNLEYLGLSYNKNITDKSVQFLPNLKQIYSQDSALSQNVIDCIKSRVH
jgi:hypothetical protein